MLTAEHARTIANQWRPRFANEASFDQSWLRFFDMVGDPTAEKLHNWLAKDQAKDEIKHAGIVQEPVLPTRQSAELDARIQAALDARVEPRHDCWRCAKFEDEPAGESCSNPRWHLPNVNEPPVEAPPGWKRLSA